jgi:hypothetical protein
MLFRESEPGENSRHAGVASESAGLREAVTDDVVAFAECRRERGPRRAAAAHLGLELTEFLLEPVELGERGMRIFSH